MSQQGWIKLHRKLIDNCIMQKPEYLTVWIYLLLSANHEENSFIWNNQKQVIKKGQLLTGRKIISEETGIPEGNVYRILNYLENEQQIKQQKTPKFTIVTILNWDTYQKDNNEMNNRLTTDEQQMNTNKNDNKKENKKITVQRMSKKDSLFWDMPAQDIRSLYTFKFGNNREVERLIKGILIKKEATEEELTASVLNYGEEIKKNKTSLTYIKDPVNFFKGYYKNYIKRKTQNNIPNITNLLTNTNGNSV